ncbi:NAD(P)-dependent oxidoreductase [Fastidiosipila sanguinis]|uniref:Oxidoreductase n=1 Tax=Fastidiosipila sanguinis TaxID=236753 RepID=A0A2S0KP35_9FIRM|nr:NAD(P)-dependent oxidoreductase [Fastidiosipila sanguinis]AVM42795.1 oxidoreductase [Fastidiosipila sanguinis]
MSKIAWIGTGVMGKPMAGYLAKAGHELRLFNRTFVKAEKAVAEYGDSVNAKAFDNILEAIDDADYIFSIVGYPRDVESVLSGPNGVIQNAKKGAIVVDMTTSSPELAEKLYSEGKEHDVKVLDAPVSGGDSGARNGTLTVMVGGDEDAYLETKDLFELMGSTINYMGKAGNGQHTKAANQIAVAGATAAYTEALVYALKVGLDPEEMLRAVGGGSAASWQLQNMAPRALEHDFDPGFFVKHFIKDMKIAKSEIEKQGIELNMLNVVLQTFEDFAAKGHEDEGTQALIRNYLADDEIKKSDKSDK